MRGRTPAAGVDPAVAIRPQPSGPKPGGIRRSLPALPVSAVGLTTRQRRGAGGGHQAVNAVDLQIQETGEAAAAQQNREQQEAWREDRETASRREKAQAKGGDRCVSTGYFRPAGPPGFYAMPAARSCGSGRKPIQAGAGLPVFNYLRTELSSLAISPLGASGPAGVKSGAASTRARVVS